MEKRYLSSELSNQIDKKVKMMGWVNTRRDHGKLIFIDLRDKDGITQVIFLPKSKAYESAKKLRPEFVVEIIGKVNKRPNGMQNDKITSGDVELEAEGLNILNESLTPPFELDKDTSLVDEEIRMKYRYLDLRTERMHANLILRSNVLNEVRNFLHNEGFVEIETPYITKGTPEGAREFIIPSRNQPGEFFVLPQSPQQFKQLLMVAGIENYFQIARCFRDEDERRDRQPEFTQIDIEMSFVNERNVMSLVENLMINIVNKISPNKHISRIPFPVISYDNAIEKYKTDHVDLRKNKKDPNELAFCWIVDFPLFEYSKTDKKLTSSHHPFTRPKDEDLKLLSKHPEKVRAYAYDLMLNGDEIWGGSIRIHKSDLQDQIFKILGLTDKDIKLRFNHLLTAFKYGCPPHGGIAAGFDRLVMNLANEPSIREVIAFPKTGDGRDLMMGAPSELPNAQISQMHIDINKNKKYKKF